MKKVLLLLAVVTITAIGFSSCHKDKDLPGCIKSPELTGGGWNCVGVYSFGNEYAVTTAYNSPGGPGKAYLFLGSSNIPTDSLDLNRIDTTGGNPLGQITFDFIDFSRVSNLRVTIKAFATPVQQSCAPSVYTAVLSPASGRR